MACVVHRRRIPTITEQEVVYCVAVAQPHGQIDVTMLASHAPDPEVDRPTPEEPAIDAALTEQLLESRDRVELLSRMRAQAGRVHGGRR